MGQPARLAGTPRRPRALRTSAAVARTSPRRAQELRPGGLGRAPQWRGPASTLRVCRPLPAGLGAPEERRGRLEAQGARAGARAQSPTTKGSVR